MANLYGVANAPTITTQMGGGSFVPSLSCPAGVFTTVGTSAALVAPSQGYFYALVLGTSLVTIGATAPSNVSFAAAIGAGSYAGGFGVNALPLVANGTFYVPWSAVTPASQVAWQGAGSVVNIGFEPIGQAVTHLQNSWALIVLLRAPDQ